MRHALIILDIDNFKNFNDTFGHFEGDKVIKAVAEKIRNTFRKTDIAGRFGGDEFIILARDIDNERWLWGKLSGLTRIETDGIADFGEPGAAAPRRLKSVVFFVGQVEPCRGGGGR